MEFSNKSLRGILYLLLICIFTQIVLAEKSVFIVSKHLNPSKAEAFSIDSSQVDYQATIDIDTLNPGNGAVGNAAWPEKGLMFFTYENSPKVVWASTKTLKKVGELDTGISSLSGIAVDEGNEKIYIVQRLSDNLYVYSFDEEENTLELDNSYVLNVPSGTLYAWGIALDETNGLLYISTSTNKVHVYDPNDWSHGHSIDISVGGTNREAVGIAVDPSNGYLYTGHWTSHTYLVRTNTASPYTSVEVEIIREGYSSKQLIGVDVDEETGYVYCTTYHHDFRVYNGNLVLQDIERNDDISGPGGVAVGGWYKSPYKIRLEKEDGITGCVEPYDEITYRITVDPNDHDHAWVTVIDYLPDGVFYDYYKDGPLNPDPNYSIPDHTYTWELGPLAAIDDPVVLKLTVTVNQDVQPGDELINIVTAESDIAYEEYTLDTCIECFGGNIIYVNQRNRDPNSIDAGNGTSWDSAYNDLQNAIKCAERGCGSVIWVAGGIYSPGKKTTDTFTIPDGFEVYGGLAGNEPNTYDPGSREYIQYKSILSGYIDPTKNNTKVVTMGEDTKLYGFVVEKGVDGISSENNFTIEYCVINGNERDGIYCENSNLTVNWSVIKDNGDNGIYNSDDGNTLTVNNCKIYNNKKHGIMCYKSTPTITNSEIHHNGNSGNVYYGIKLEKPSDNPYIRNNTIVYNNNEGIQLIYNGYSPSVRNCILWHNDAGDDYRQYDGFSDTHIYDSCVTDPNDPFIGSSIPDGNGNISSDPIFANSNPDIYNYHLSVGSYCRDAGDETIVGVDELDIDSDDRIDDTDVDMGADELSSSCEYDYEIANPMDFNGDGLVNNKEFAIFFDAWLAHDPNDPGYSPDPEEYARWSKVRDYNFDKNGTSQYQIDIDDLMFLANDWLWQACWKNLEGPWMMAMGRGMGQGMRLESVSLSQTAAIAKPELTIEEQIAQAEDGLEFFEKLLKDKDVMEEVNTEDIYGLIDSLESLLYELKEGL